MIHLTANYRRTLMFFLCCGVFGLSNVRLLSEDASINFDLERARIMDGLVADLSAEYRSMDSLRKKALKQWFSALEEVYEKGDAEDKERVKNALVEAKQDLAGHLKDMRDRERAIDSFIRGGEYYGFSLHSLYYVRNATNGVTESKPVTGVSTNNIVKLPSYRKPVIEQPQPSPQQSTEKQNRKGEEDPAKNLEALGHPESASGSLGSSALKNQETE